MPDNSTPPMRQSILRVVRPSMPGPVAGGGAPQKVLSCSVKPQLANFWCWAAVSEGLATYFHGSSKTQCAIASDTLGTGFTCCTNAGPCDRPHLLIPALEKVGLRGDYHPGPLGFDDLKAIINSGSPLAITISWLAGGFHFIVVNGWFDGSSGSKVHQVVFVQDSLGSYGQVSYRSLVASYGNQQASGGSWRDYYLVSALPAGPVGGGGLASMMRAADRPLMGLTTPEMSVLMDKLSLTVKSEHGRQPVEGG